MNTINPISNIQKRNQKLKRSSVVEKRIRFLQRELVRLSFDPNRRPGLYQQLLSSIEKERAKIGLFS